MDRIRECLQLRLYRTIEDFEKDMNGMFADWLERNKPNQRNTGDGHRYFRTAVAIQDRFHKSMQKAYEKLAEFQEKALLKHSRLQIQSQMSQMSRE